MNVERVFLRAGSLSHWNMDPRRLATLVMVGINKQNFKPAVKDIQELYYKKFRGKSKDKDHQRVATEEYDQE